MSRLSEANAYIWKCWRDTRGTFTIILAAALAGGAFFLYVALDPFGWIAAKPLETRVAWQFSAEGFFGTLLGVIPATGLVLGALGVGTEFEKRTAELLLTRPRTRRWFLWTSWGVGAAQMALLVLVSNLFRFAASGSSRFRVGSLENFSFSLLALWTLALVYYSLTYLMTTLARNGRNGTALALGAFSLYVIAFLVLRGFYGIQIPFMGELFSMTFRTTADFAFTLVAGWLAVCAAMTVAAQISFERAEV